MLPATTNVLHQRPDLKKPYAIKFFITVLALALFIPASNGAAKPTTQAKFTTEKIKLDGHLDESVWASAMKAGGDMQQYEPRQGVPMTQKTEFMVVYDEDSIYFGIIAYDTEPKKIVASVMERDEVPFYDDSLFLAIDTMNDNRNGYVLWTNPNGIKYDASVTNNSSLNVQWDGIWDVKAVRTKHGWQAEIRLPFSTVRHRAGANVWGFNLWRKLPRNGEEGRWSESRPEIRTYHFAQAGKIEGININRRNLNLEVTPYVVGDITNSKTSGDFGGDIRYRFKPNWTAHLTLNTDFAETEVDDRRLNYTRFPLFFPEKRDFFLEDAEVFTVGQQVMPWSAPEIVPYFSRRIGLNHDRQITDLDYAVKLTGHEGKYHVGLLNSGVGASSTSPSSNLTIARIKRDVLEQSSIGLISTFGDPNSDEHASTHGVDFRHRTDKLFGNRVFEANSYLLSSHNSAQDDGTAFSLELLYPNDLINAGATYYRIDEDFDPKLGYVRRTGVNKFQNHLSWQPRFDNSQVVRQAFLSYTNSIYANLGGGGETIENSVVLPRIMLESTDEIFLKYSHFRDNPDYNFLVPGAGTINEGDYEWNTIAIGGGLSNKRKLGATASVAIHDDWYDWDRTDYNLGFRWSINKHLLLSTSHRYSHFEQEDEDEDVLLNSARLLVNINPNMGLLNVVQHDSYTDTIGLYSRFRWEWNPGQELFVVLRHGYRDDYRGFDLETERYSVKISSSFRF